jgi:hypothetical protein
MLKFFILALLMAFNANLAEAKAPKHAKPRVKETSTYSRKRPKNIPVKKPKPLRLLSVVYFNWPEGLEIFGQECPNKGFIEEVYGKTPDFIYEVRVVCKGNIERYEHFFLIKQSQVIKIEKPK